LVHFSLPSGGEEGAGSGNWGDRTDVDGVSVALDLGFAFYFAEFNVGGVPTVACQGLDGKRFGATGSGDDAAIVDDVGGFDGLVRRGLGADGAIGNGELPSSDGGGVGGVGGLAGKIFD